MKKIILLLVVQVVKEICILGRGLGHLKPIVAMLAIGEAGRSNIMLQGML